MAPRCPFTAFAAVFLAIAPLSRAGTACESLLNLERAGQVFGCGEELLKSNDTSESQAQSMREVLGVLKDFQQSCVQGLHVLHCDGVQNSKQFGSRMGVPCIVPAMGLWKCAGGVSKNHRSHLLCHSNKAGMSWKASTKAYSLALYLSQWTEVEESITKEHNKSPEKGMLPSSWRLARLAVKELYFWVTALIWRETQWQWLSDSFDSRACCTYSLGWAGRVAALWCHRLLRRRPVVAQWTSLRHERRASLHRAPLPGLCQLVERTASATWWRWNAGCRSRSFRRTALPIHFETSWLCSSYWCGPLFGWWWNLSGSFLQRLEPWYCTTTGCYSLQVLRRKSLIDANNFNRSSQLATQ